MISDIVEAIGEDSSTKKVRREVNLLTEIQVCQRILDERTSDITACYNTTISGYTNHIQSLDAICKGQFDILMLRTTNLSPETMNDSLF